MGKIKVFLISTKDVDLLFEPKSSGNVILFNEDNYASRPIKDIYDRCKEKLTLYDFFLNLLNSSAGFFDKNEFPYILDLKKAGNNIFFKEESEIQIKLNEYTSDITEPSSKHFNKIFQLKSKSGEPKNIFLARCFPHKLIQLLGEKGKINSSKITNNYWLVCYINTVMNILRKPEGGNGKIEEYEFYGLLHNHDVNTTKNVIGESYTINSYDGSPIQMQLFSYSHEENKIYDNIIKNATLFDEFDEQTDACEYLLKKLYFNDGIFDKIEDLKNIGAKELDDNDLMFLFNCKSEEINKKMLEYKNFFNKDIKDLFLSK